MTKLDQYASSLLHKPKPTPKLWDSCPSLTRLHTNDVDLSSGSSVHRTQVEGVELIGEEMEMEMTFRWKERGNEIVKEMEREQKKEDIKLTNTGERSKKEMKVEREKSMDEIWKGVWI